MANSELGAKQVCPNCQTKFYDLGRRPAVCPKCATAFDPEEAVRSRRVRARSVTPNYDAEDEVVAKPRESEEDAEDFEEEVEETPEIDETPVEPVEPDEGEDAGATPAPEGDIGVDFEEEAADLEEDEAEDLPFLEEEDEPFPDDEIEGLPDDDRDHH